MKKIGIAFLLCLTGFAAFAQNVSLDEAIQSVASEISQRLPQGSKVAVLSFTSESDRLSRYVIDELNNGVVNEGKLVVVDRQQMDLIMQEMEFQVSGLVSDESAQSIGRMLGAQYIVSGSMELIAGSWRFRTRALAVENATIAYSGSRDVVNDRIITSLAGKDGGGITGDFTASERTRARWLNLLWGAGSFSQRDILGGGITALLEAGGLACIGIGLGTLSSTKHESAIIFAWGTDGPTFTFDGQTYNSESEANGALMAYNEKKETTGVILVAAGGVLGVAGIVYGFVRPSFAHRPGYAAGSPADPANWRLTLVSDDRGDPAFRLTYRMSF
jgi:TolB-like protein